MAGDKSELIHRVADLSKQFGRYMHDDHLDAWLALNLTIVQFKSLMIINFEGSTNFKTLARILRVSPPNVTGVVDRLVEQELVSREDNPQNRRMQILKVTEKGDALIRDLLERGETRFSKALDGMQTEDLEHLVYGMTALIAAARESQENSALDAADYAATKYLDQE
jgi:MarR family transcriptional regulator, organic hydroperoxide resistance regulator